MLPVLFAAGMTLFDTADGVFMAHAYKWALLSPIRRIYYNLTVTILSVVVALVIGGIVLLQLLAERFHIVALSWATRLDLQYLGYLMVGLFAVIWAISVSTWRFGRIEERMQNRL